MARTVAFQQYSLREYEGGMAAALETVTSMGVFTIEPWCGAVPANPEEGTSIEALRQRFSDAGVRLTCGHMTVDEFDTRYTDWRDLLRGFGSTAWVVPFARAETLEAWLALIPTFERMADQLEADGLSLGYHNHHMELQQFGEKRVMEHLLDAMPRLRGQFHIGQFLPERGVLLPDWIAKYNGRICALHVNDATSAGPAPLGQGDCRAEESIRAALDAGVETFIVEVDVRESTVDAVRRDVERLQEIVLS